MARKDARALRDEVASAIDKGKFKRAIECILELEQLEPRDASWPKRAAEVYRRLGQSREAISAYERAAERYAQAGFLVQAIAVCKLILQIDPQHLATLRRLTKMSEERQTGPTGVRSMSVAAEAIPEMVITRNTGPIARVDPAALMPEDRSLEMLELERRSRPLEAIVPDFELPDSGLAEGSAATPEPATVPDMPRAHPPTVLDDRRDEPTLQGEPVPSLAPSMPAAATRAPTLRDPPVPELPAEPPTTPAMPAALRAPTPALRPPTPALRSGATVTPPLAVPRVIPPTRPPTSPVVPPPLPRPRAQGMPGLPPPIPPPPIPPPPGGTRVRRNSPPPLSGGQRRRRADSSVPIPMEPGAPLDALPLSEVLSGAETQRRTDGLSSGIIVIPLDDFDDNSGPIQIETVETSLEDSIDLPYDAFDTPEPQDLEELRVEAMTSLEEEMGTSHSLSVAARRALTSTPLLSGLLPDELEVLVSKLDLVTLDPGQILFKEGDDGDSLYIISEGEIAVISEGPPRKELSRLLAGAFFGEIALITEQPRSATIAAVRRTELLVIDRDDVRALVAEHPDTLRVILRFIRNRLVERVIQTSPLFAQFEALERREIAERFDFLEVEPGTRLNTQGVRPDGLYVILAGRAEAQRDLDGATRRLGDLQAGEVFGEMALYGSQPALATVVAKAKMLALRMPATTFREVIMTHPMVLAYVGELAEKRRRQIEEPSDSGDVVDLKLDLI